MLEARQQEIAEESLDERRKAAVPAAEEAEEEAADVADVAGEAVEAVEVFEGVCPEEEARLEPRRLCPLMR